MIRYTAIRGSTFRRCPHGTACPDLAAQDHGSWFWMARLDASAGRKMVRRGGFSSQPEAEVALTHVKTLIAEAPDPIRTADDVIAGTLRGGRVLSSSDVLAQRRALKANSQLLAQDLIISGRCTAKCLLAYTPDECDCPCDGKWHGAGSHLTVPAEGVNPPGATKRSWEYRAGYGTHGGTSRRLTQGS